MHSLLFNFSYEITLNIWTLYYIDSGKALSLFLHKNIYCGYSVSTHNVFVKKQEKYVDNPSHPELCVLLTIPFPKFDDDDGLVLYTSFHKLS